MAFDEQQRELTPITAKEERDQEQEQDTGLTTTVEQIEDDDDVIKVDSGTAMTPQERARFALSKLTKTDATAAKSQAKRLKKFVPKLEKAFQQFRRAYGLSDDQTSRVQFADFLGRANLGAKAQVTTPQQQSAAAKQVLFDTYKTGSTVPRNAVGLRDALDPRQPLTEAETLQLQTLLLPDGKNAFAARQEAERLWATKQIVVEIDVAAVYSTDNPHLAAFESAARDAGYTQQEIDMVVKGKSSNWLWSSQSTQKTMPATLAEFRAQREETGDLDSYTLDANRLEDARMAIAQGLTLAQFDAARSSQRFDANVFPGLGDQSSLANPTLVDWTKPLATCVAVSGTLGLVTGSLLRCSNGKTYFGAGVTTQFGAGAEGQVLVVFGKPGVSADDVISGNSYGFNASTPLKLGPLGVGVGVSGNSFGYITSGSGGESAKISLPAGVSWTDTVEFGKGLPFITSTGESINTVLSDKYFAKSPVGIDDDGDGKIDRYLGGRGQLRQDLEQWPTTSNALGHGLYKYLTGGEKDFEYQLPDVLGAKWKTSAQRKEVLRVVETAGGDKLLTREQRWMEVAGRLKELVLEFYNAEVAKWPNK